MAIMTAGIARLDQTVNNRKTQVIKPQDAGISLCMEILLVARNEHLKFDYKTLLNYHRF